MKKMNVEAWVAMFEEVGLDEAARKKWHKLFEARHPEAHQSFLEWMDVSEEKIKQIRANSR